MNNCYRVEGFILYTKNTSSSNKPTYQKPKTLLSQDMCKSMQQNYRDDTNAQFRLFNLQNKVSGLTR